MMLATEKTNVIIIYGPTATGKTALAIYLAKKYNGELISADSRQVYRGLDVGSGKVSFDSKIEKHQGFWIVDGVKINGFDLVSPQESFTAADFIEFASATRNRIIKAGKLPIIVGGTGFYINVLIKGIDTIGIKQNPILRSKLEKLDRRELYQKLLEVDPQKAKSLNSSDSQNTRRLIRAIEVSLSKVDPTHTLPPIPHNLLIGLTASNDFIYKKSDAWVEERFEHICQEIKTLHKNGVNYKWLGNLGLEYKWVTRFLTAKVKKEDSIRFLKNEIHDFIRRQKTWFNKFEGIKLFDVSAKNWQKNLEKTVTEYLQSKR